ncbi:MAG TPA: hypothetical protein VF498_17230 [Anaerolineales bacterium]
METKRVSSTAASKAGSAFHVEKERAQFTQLMLENPNYFGNLEKSPYKAVKKIVGNTTYEQVTCLGYNPNLSTLEATIQIKRPAGYGGNLCSNGSIEYVHFYIDYGTGWQDLDGSSFNIHDIPNGPDCAGQPDKPLVYVLSHEFKPEQKYCKYPVMPQVRAILSWNLQPPAGQPNWPPIWGNVLDVHILIKPRFPILWDLAEIFSEEAGKKLKLPKEFEAVAAQPLPIPDPGPLKSLAALAAEYRQPKAAARGKAAGAHPEAAHVVEPHRFGAVQLNSALSSGGLSQEMIAANFAEWQAAGLDFSKAVAALQETSGNTTYEELYCLGLDYNREWLAATFTIKLPNGYSGSLCDLGSKEYVSFWADWEDTCKWTYLGTMALDAHDIAKIPAGGLQYTAVWPVALDAYRRNCEKPRIARVRAVLSWNVAPSTTDPDALPYWGNRLDAHVQIRPGETGGTGPRIAAIGGIGLASIDVFGTGMTEPGAKFAYYSFANADPWDSSRMCPFGGTVTIQGVRISGYKYRLWVQKSDGTNNHYLDDPVWVTDAWGNSYNHFQDHDGIFRYLEPEFNMASYLSNAWAPGGDSLWQVRLELFDGAENFVGVTPWYNVQMDNTYPTIDLNITGGVCDEYTPGTTINGTFVAGDLHFGIWTLSTLPNTASTPSNQPVAVPLISNTSPTPALGSGWTLSTTTPVKMRPCGYVIHLEVYDNSIVNSVPGQHNARTTDAGFCLLKP